jgi:hypothetical protein
MARADADKQRPQRGTQTTEAEARVSEPAPSVQPPVRRPRILTRGELETLRARLQKKFH